MNLKISKGRINDEWNKGGGFLSLKNEQDLMKRGQDVRWTNTNIRKIFQITKYRKYYLKVRRRETKKEIK